MRQDAALSLPDGMSPGGRTQNRSLRYKRLERPVHRVSGERQNARYFFCLYVQDAHDQLPPCLPGPHPSSPIPDAQYLFRPEEEDERETPHGVGLPLPDSGVLPAPSRPVFEAFHGLGQVRCGEDPPHESRKRLSGRPPDLEVPGRRYLLPPLRLGTRNLRARHPILPLETAQPVAPPPRRY